jgi:hypothetical protein
MGRFTARPEPGESADCFVVSPEDMMKIETIELLIELSDLLSVCHHAGVMAVRLPHDLVDDELRVIADLNPMDPELDSDAHAVDEGLIFCHIVGHVEVRSNHVEESISLGVD